jgi:hypothetical protein
MTKLIKYFIYSILGIFIFMSIVTIGNTIKIRLSEEYGIAKDLISKNKEVISKIGRVEKYGLFPSGSIRVENGIDYAQIETEVTGESGDVYVILRMMKNYKNVWIAEGIFVNEIKD